MYLKPYNSGRGVIAWPWFSRLVLVLWCATVRSPTARDTAERGYFVFDLAARSVTFHRTAAEVEQSIGCALGAVVDETIGEEG